MKFELTAKQVETIIGYMQGTLELEGDTLIRADVHGLNMDEQLNIAKMTLNGCREAISLYDDLKDKIEGHGTPFTIEDIAAYELVSKTIMPIRGWDAWIRQTYPSLKTWK